MTPPSDQSFLDFFKEWFEETHFPKLNSLLKKEMVKRASEKSFFSGLSSQIKKWVHANSDPRLQSNVWYVYFKQHSPPTFSTFGCFRMAQVNMGSTAEPCVVRFYGYPGDMPSILEELDERGGMAALVSSATTSALDTIEE